MEDFPSATIAEESIKDTDTFRYFWYNCFKLDVALRIWP